MNDFASLLQQGNAWLFIPSAILLGALHGRIALGINSQRDSAGRAARP